MVLFVLLGLMEMLQGWLLRSGCAGCAGRYVPGDMFQAMQR